MSEQNQTINIGVNIGGSIATATAGRYNINLHQIVKEAWSFTRKQRISIMAGMGVVFAISIITTMLMTNYIGDLETAMKDQKSMMMLNLVITVVTAPFLVGIEMMGIAHSAGAKSTPGMVFSYLGRGAWVAIAALLTLTITNLGFALFVFPGIFLLVALLPVNQLVIEKRMTPIQAITVCVRTFFRKQWINVFMLYAFVIGCGIVSLLPMIVLQTVPVLGFAITLFAITYLIPFYYNVKGIVYRDVFGVTTKTDTKIVREESRENTFDA